MFAASASTRARLLARSCRRIARSGAGRAPAAAFSTISLDGSAFDVPATSSSESPLTPYSFWKQPPPVNQPARQLSKNTSADQFVQQTHQWMANNPKIAPYKAEEALARLWVDQQELFKQWEQQQQRTPSPTVLLTTETVNLVLEAWCMSSNGEVAAERAERLLHWMEDLQPEDSAWAAFLPKADYQSYATCIDAWSRAAVYESTHPGPSGSDEIEKKSGGRAKSHVVSSATKNGFECAKRAEDLLMHMQRVHEQRLEQSEGYNSDIQPDTRVFNSVLTAWSKIRGGTKASATRAMRILDLMQELHHYQSMKATEWQSLAFSKVQPNLKTYKLVLEAWASANHTLEGPDRAEEILRHLLSLSKAGNLGVEISPDAECFNIVMKAHAEAIRKRRKGGDGSASVERAQRVTALLDWMELLAVQNAKVRPTAESYRTVLSAWVWSHHVNAPMEADGILYRMIRAGEVSDRESSIILASGVPGAKPKAESLVQPETRDFNTVINCCSFARRVGLSEEDDDSLLQRQIAHEEVFNIAEAALNALLASKYAQPDSATFAGIIRACLNLLPNTDERDERVIELFRLAYHTPPAEAPPTKITSTSAERMAAPPGAGCVDANVLRQLRHALPSTEDYIRVREEFEDYRRKNVGDE